MYVVEHGDVGAPRSDRLEFPQQAIDRRLHPALGFKKIGLDGFVNVHTPSPCARPGGSAASSFRP